MKNAEIADKLDTCPEVISSWVRRYKTSAECCLRSMISSLQRISRISETIEEIYGFEVSDGMVSDTDVCCANEKI